MNSHAYLKIADDLRQKILSGQYGPGAVLPSITALANQYGVSENTVIAARTVLLNEGLIDTPGPGRPTTVRRKPIRIVRDGTRRYHIEKDLARHGGLPSDTHLAREVGAPDEEAKVTLIGRDVIPGGGEIGWILGLDVTEQIRQYTFHIGVHGSAIGRLAHHYFPADLDDQVAQAQPGNALGPDAVIWPGGTFHQLAHLAIEPIRVHERITARMPLPDEREHLGLSEGVPLLIVRKITFGEYRAGDDSAPAVEVVDVLMPGDSSESVYDIELPPWPAGWRMDLRDDSDTD